MYIWHSLHCFSILSTSLTNIPISRQNIRKSGKIRDSLELVPGPRIVNGHYSSFEFSSLCRLRWFKTADVHLLQPLQVKMNLRLREWHDTSNLVFYYSVISIANKGDTALIRETFSFRPRQVPLLVIYEPHWERRLRCLREISGSTLLRMFIREFIFLIVPTSWW